MKIRIGMKNINFSGNNLILQLFFLIGGGFSKKFQNLVDLFRSTILSFRDLLKLHKDPVLAQLLRRRQNFEKKTVRKRRF